MERLREGIRHAEPPKCACHDAITWSEAYARRYAFPTPSLFQYGCLEGAARLRYVPGISVASAKLLARWGHARRPDLWCWMGLDLLMCQLARVDQGGPDCRRSKLIRYSYRVQGDPKRVEAAQEGGGDPAQGRGGTSTSGCRPQRG